MEDLFQEFMEHILQNDERSMRAARLKYLGYDSPITGDPLVDLWLQQVARGETPNLDLGEAENSKRRDALLKKAAEDHFKRTGETIYYPLYRDFLSQDYVRVGHEHSTDTVILPDEEMGHMGGSMTDADGETTTPEAYDKLLNAMGAFKRDI